MPDLVPAADELEDDSPRISILLRYIIIFSGSQHNTQRLATYIKAHDPTGIIPARGGGVAVSYRTPGLGDYSGGTLHRGSDRTIECAGRMALTEPTPLVRSDRRSHARWWTATEEHAPVLRPVGARGGCPPWGFVPPCARGSTDPSTGLAYSDVSLGTQKAVAGSPERPGVKYPLGVSQHPLTAISPSHRSCHTYVLRPVVQ